MPILQQALCLAKRRTPLEVRVECHTETCFLWISGGFCTGNDSDYLRSRMNEIANLSCATIVADFTRVAAIGAEGVSFLVGLYRLSNGHLIIVNPQPRVSEVLAVTCLTRIITVVPSLDSKLTSCGNLSCKSGQMRANEP